MCSTKFNYNIMIVLIIIDNIKINFTNIEIHLYKIIYIFHCYTLKLELHILNRLVFLIFFNILLVNKHKYTYLK